MGVLPTSGVLNSVAPSNESGSPHQQTNSEVPDSCCSFVISAASRSRSHRAGPRRRVFRHQGVPGALAAGCVSEVVLRSRVAEPGARGLLRPRGAGVAQAERTGAPGSATRVRTGAGHRATSLPCVLPTSRHDGSSTVFTVVGPLPFRDPGVAESGPLPSAGNSPMGCNLVR